jgi:hypothetical protein
VRWWAWLGVWTVLVLGAGGVFFVLGRRLWRESKALLAEIGVAGERAGALLAQVDALGEQVSTRAEPAVFADPARLRRERDAAVRRRARASRRRRRELLRARGGA